MSTPLHSPPSAFHFPPWLESQLCSQALLSLGLSTSCACASIQAGLTDKLDTRLTHDSPLTQPRPQNTLGAYGSPLTALSSSGAGF